MVFGGFNWTIILIVAPLLLLAAIAFAASRNRSSRVSDAETERATRKLYREEDRATRGEDDDVP